MSEGLITALDDPRYTSTAVMTQYRNGIKVAEKIERWVKIDGMSITDVRWLLDKSLTAALEREAFECECARDWKQKADDYGSQTITLRRKLEACRDALEKAVRYVAAEQDEGWELNDEEREWIAMAKDALRRTE